MGDDNGTIDIPKGKLVGGSWVVTRKLGEGGCGSVYLVKNIDDDTEAAMKAESSLASGGCVLKLEVAMLKKLNGKPHVAQLLFSAKVSTFSYVIMTLLGDSLGRITKKLGRAVTVSSQVRVAINVLFCLKQIHDVGFIHRDLKPANMALGRPGTSECRFFHILDFGLARQFVVPNSDDPKIMMMRRPRDKALFRGTTRYCSIRMHDRVEQGRVDDLWSMLYLLAELRGPLPWAAQSDKKVVGEMKRLHTDEFVLQNSPLEFLEIAKHLRSLNYYTRPDYLKIFLLLVSVMLKGKFSWNDPFDWEMGPGTSKSPAASSPNVRRSRESTGKKSNMSREMAKSYLSKELIKPGKDKGPSAEKMSAEKSNDEKEELKYDRDEILQILPFDPEFFKVDPIGF